MSLSKTRLGEEDDNLSRLISAIESLLVLSGGTLVFFGSSLHFAALQKLVRLTKIVLRHGSKTRDLEGNNTISPFIKEVLISEDIKDESSFDVWMTERMANSEFNTSLRKLTSRSDAVERHYESYAILRKRHCVNKLLKAAKCLDEQDLFSLVALDSLVPLESSSSSSSSSSSPSTHCAIPPPPPPPPLTLHPSSSSSSLRPTLSNFDSSSSCPDLTQLSLKKFLNQKNWNDNNDQQRHTTKPLPPELETILRTRLEDYDKTGARPKHRLEETTSSSSSFSSLHSSQQPSTKSLNSSPIKRHRRTTSDTSILCRPPPPPPLLKALRRVDRQSAFTINKSSEDHGWSTVAPPTDGWRIPAPRKDESLYNYLLSGSFSRHQARLDQENAHIILAEIIIQATTKRAGDLAEKKSMSGSSSSTAISSTPQDDLESLAFPKPNSAESVALVLLDQFDDKHLTKASELNWMVSDQDNSSELLSPPSSEVDSNQTELRGTLDWAPPRPQLILQLHPKRSRNDLLEEQKFRCAGCSMTVAKKYCKTYRYCHYFGKYFCTGCHSNQTSLIPASIINKWDFKEFLVSDYASTVLKSMKSDPLFNVKDLNLFKKVPKLKKAVEVRLLTVGIYPFIKNCRLVKELKSDIESYPVIDPYTLSMDDLHRIKNGSYIAHLKSLIDDSIDHILHCSLCNARGFICEGCRSLDVIFPFESGVYQCSSCYACFHSPCYSKPCTKCRRLNQRKLARADDNQSLSHNSFL